MDDWCYSTFETHLLLYQYNFLLHIDPSCSPYRTALSWKHKTFSRLRWLWANVDCQIVILDVILTLVIPLLCFCNLKEKKMLMWKRNLFLRNEKISKVFPISYRYSKERNYFKLKKKNSISIELKYKIHYK